MNEQQVLTQPRTIDNDQIDYITLIKKLWNGRKIIILTVTVGAIFGIISALLSPKEFTATTVMVPQLSNESQSKLGGLGGLAALAGINIDMNQGGEMSPMIYPHIVNSIPFQLELMNMPLNFKEYPKPITLLEYFAKTKKTSILGTIMKYTIGLPGVLIKAIRGEPKEFVLQGDSTTQPIRLTKEQFSAKKGLTTW